MTEQALLILDLDETLVHASSERLSYESHFMVGEYYVYKRPFLSEFLAGVSEHFKVAVWSSASDEYVSDVVANIFDESHSLQFVWGRSRAVRTVFPDAEGRLNTYDPDHTEFVKPLKKVGRLGWPLERVLIVDDTPRKAVQNYGNVIYPSEFEGDQDDRELLHLLKYLISIRDVGNFRKLEKRHWRRLVNASDYSAR
ncbi:HAD family hydrolase [Hyphobacterium sp. HN65]|uniref:HAD family hydrolase n=1 Tax=Hyphobacterium lacteum TaxID=3116575 RepID=A0ABU7LR65_9PROT|nr:HAD family hydrolase [Hyphobacterium sp. HN65]MEE2526387.1 HAD family hydrolase [Hyphobacterium sp. HN65]